METELEKIELKMSECWAQILQSSLAKEIQNILTSGNRQLYALWLIQVAHLTKHTSVHQALVGTRYKEISHVYMKFCFEHAMEEVGHEMMALSDLKRIGAKVARIDQLPPPLAATEQLNAYLYYVSQYAHPATRLGFSYWAEKCYPFIHSMASGAQSSMGLSDQQMTFFVSHSRIDEKHADDVERIVKSVCKTPEDWQAVTQGMETSLHLAIQIFEQIHQLSLSPGTNPEYSTFLEFLNVDH
jgi:hypothetical protein